MVVLGTEMQLVRESSKFLPAGIYMVNFNWIRILEGHKSKCWTKKKTFYGCFSFVQKFIWVFFCFLGYLFKSLALALAKLAHSLTMHSFSSVILARFIVSFLSKWIRFSFHFAIVSFFSFIFVYIYHSLIWDDRNILTSAVFIACEMFVLLDCNFKCHIIVKRTITSTHYSMLFICRQTTEKCEWRLSGDALSQYPGMNKLS